jgi:hypothetical protein
MEQTEMWRDPHIPIHPDLRTYALGLLREKTPLAVVREKARQFAVERWGDAPGSEHYRFRLRDHDSSSLYRSLNKEIGILPHTEAQLNLHQWFMPGAKSLPDPSLAASCLFYQPEIPEKGQRFMLILSTPVQQKMAWKFGHNRQVLMDLTFGFSSARALLVILMAIDDANKGIPIGYIIFTAKREAKAVHADYNTEILDEGLRHFKDGMGRNTEGEVFNIAIGITDNDLRERNALDKNFPAIFLLLCMFHVMQAWRNRLNQDLSAIPQGENRQAVRSRLWRLLYKLIRDISDYSAATTLFNNERAYYKDLGKSGSTPMAKKQSKAALKFLNYLAGYLQSEVYWRSWSPAGPIEAARRLGNGITPAFIARTTNHLESFNGRIKTRLLRDYEHCGRLPRIDVWVLVLVTRVMPEFFEAWLEKRRNLAYYSYMRQAPDLSVSSNSSMTSQDSATKIKKFVTVAEVVADAEDFMDRAFKKVVIRSNHFSAAFANEHQQAVFDFEQSLMELGEVDMDESEIVLGRPDIPFLGGQVIDEDNGLLYLQS